MLNNNTISQNTQLTPDQTAASLAFATNLQEHLLPPPQAQNNPVQSASSPQSASQAQETTPGSEVAGAPEKRAPKEDKAEIELMMTQKMEEMRKELKDDMHRELDNIKQLITQALNDKQDETQ